MRSFERDLLALLPRLRRFARSLSRDLADADDLLQIALERALKARDAWQPGTRLDAWMMKIIRNCWIDEVRSRARRSQTFLEEDGASTVVDVLGGEARANDRHSIDWAMGRLSPDQREVVALVLVEGLSYREAADVLEIPIGTLTSRLNRGRQTLAGLLEAA